MKKIVLSLLAVVSSSVALGGDTLPTDADWRWLERNSERVLETLMPVEDATRPVARFRTSRLVQFDFPECYFRIAEEFPGQRLSAKVVAPLGKSLQPQLLDLHRHDPSATLDQLLPQLRMIDSDLSEESCPVIRERMVKLAKVHISIPTLNAFALDSAEYRIIINTGDGDIDATLCEQRLPIVRWATQSCEVLRRCAEAGHGTVKP